jgi:hypothetical protein
LLRNRHCHVTMEMQQTHYYTTVTHVTMEMPSRPNISQYYANNSVHCAGYRKELEACSVVTLNLLRCGTIRLHNRSSDDRVMTFRATTGLWNESWYNHYIRSVRNVTKIYVGNFFIHVRFQVLAAASMKFRVFWIVAPCSLIGMDWRFGGA